MSPVNIDYGKYIRAQRIGTDVMVKNTTGKLHGFILDTTKQDVFQVAIPKSKGSLCFSIVTIDYKDVEKVVCFYRNGTRYFHITIGNHIDLKVKTNVL